MIRRFYVHNFRCLENFELPISGLSSVLLIGKNGSGKTTVGLALEVLQRIARGTNRVGELVKPTDFTGGRTEVPMRFEITVELGGRVYEYGFAFELPEGFKQLRVLDEKFALDGVPVYTREMAEVRLVRDGQADKEGEFRLDWHLVALPIIQERSIADPVFILKKWLRRMLILRPVPSLISGNSDEHTLLPNSQVTNFGAWFLGLLSYTPKAWGKIDEYLKQVMPDFDDIKNEEIGGNARKLVVQFANDQGSIGVPFQDLSDGEKCFMIGALVLVANRTPDGPFFCFWDEPDNYLAMDEVGHFVLALRKGFRSGGQFIATSHNPEAVRSFSDENTLLFHRRGHLEPILVRQIDELQIPGDLVGALIRGDVEP